MSDEPTSQPASQNPSEAEFLIALRNVIDPELGVNIVDLGLIYEITVKDNAANVRMTMTTPACPMGPYITEQVERVIADWFPQLGPTKIDLVFEPLWKPERMTAQARRELGWE